MHIREVVEGTERSAARKSCAQREKLTETRSSRTASLEPLAQPTTQGTPPCRVLRRTRADLHPQIPPLLNFTPIIASPKYSNARFRPPFSLVLRYFASLRSRRRLANLPSQKYQLSEKLRTRLLEIFRQIDKDGNKEINKEETMLFW